MFDDVKNRSEIIIHPANNAIVELRGCIAPVTIFDLKTGTGLDSPKAFKRFIDLCQKNFGKGNIELVVSTSLFWDDSR
jgi:hypothetical protein